MQSREVFERLLGLTGPWEVPECPIVDALQPRGPELAGELNRYMATAEDLRSHQLHLVEQGTSSTTLNGTLPGLRFFVEVTSTGRR